MQVSTRSSTKSRCPKCQGMVSTHLETRDHQPSNGAAPAKNLQVMVCDVCGTPLGFPHSKLANVQQAVAESSALSASDTLEDLLRGVTRDKMAPTEEGREWLDARPVGKEILD